MPTKLEFQKFISQKSFEDLRNTLLDSNVHYTKYNVNFNFQTLPKLLNTKYFLWLNVVDGKNISIKGYNIHPQLAIVEIKYEKYFDISQLQLQVTHNCVYSMNVEIYCGQIIQKTSKNMSKSFEKECERWSK